MLAQQVLHAVNTQSLTHGVWKEHASITPLRLPEPSVQHGDSGFGQWRTAFLAAFADDAHTSARSKDEVFAFGPRDLRQAQTRLDRHQDKRVIAPPEPGAPARSGLIRVTEPGYKQIQSLRFSCVPLACRAYRCVVIRSPIGWDN
jgi:hypothetical protein